MGRRAGGAADQDAGRRRSRSCVEAEDAAYGEISGVIGPSRRSGSFREGPLAFLGMTEWNFASVWEGIAAEAPERDAVVCGERRRSFGEFDDRARRLAGRFAAAGLGPGDQVAIELVNSIEYLETFFAALKLGCAPVNVNYRYVGSELAHLLDNSDARALVFHDEFGPTVTEALTELDDRPLLITVPHEGGAPPEGVESYDEALAFETAPDLHRTPSGDDLILLYTGGTTGMPKGVMWRNDDLYRALWQNARPGKPIRDPVEAVRAGKQAVTTLPACPLMHGTGLFAALSTLSGGGTVVLLDTARLDADAVWGAVEREAVVNLVIVGDAFARPLLAALDASPDRWDLSSLRAITSSGVMWSPETKRGLLGHLPEITLVDSMGASEGLMTRSTATSGDREIPSATFEANERITVLHDDGSPVEAGSGDIGLLAVGGPIPLGYYKDPEKTAATFKESGGRRFSIPGDYATLEADGTIHLLGRGSQCINTGGEKVYPEEVDEVVKSHPDVFDCVTVGVPDERWGEKVVAVVRSRDGTDVDPAALDRFCRDRMAGYKRPKAFLMVDDLKRSPSGKADYRMLKALAAERVGAASPGS